MPSIYLEDEINIISYSTDTWGVTTRSENLGVSARVEDKQKWVKNQNGSELMADTLIIIESAETISWNDKIQVTKRNGVTQKEADKEYAIKSIHKAAGFTASHIEVYI